MEQMTTLVKNTMLDGGGVRGLSSIRILKNIMDCINAKRTPDDTLQPWQVFDMTLALACKLIQAIHELNSNSGTSECGGAPVGER